MKIKNLSSPVVVTVEQPRAIYEVTNSGDWKHGLCTAYCGSCTDCLCATLLPHFYVSKEKKPKQ